MPYCPSKTTPGRFAASLTIVARNTTIFASRTPSLERVSEDEAEKATEMCDIGADDAHGEEKKEDKPGNDGEKGNDEKAVIQRLVARTASADSADSAASKSTPSKRTRSSSRPTPTSPPSL